MDAVDESESRRDNEFVRGVVKQIEDALNPRRRPKLASRVEDDDDYDPAEDDD